MAAGLPKTVSRRFRRLRFAIPSSIEAFETIRAELAVIKRDLAAESGAA